MNFNDISTKSFTPSSDGAQTLGVSSIRWEETFTKRVSDGEGGSFTPGEAATAARFAAEKNHDELTAESRAAAGSHPIGAIAGLSDILQPATAASDGLMSAADKSRLNGIFPAGGQTFYVDPAGNDANPGTAAAPFKTVRGALAAVGGRIVPSQYNITFWMRPGEYVESGMTLPRILLGSSITFTSSDANNRAKIIAPSFSVQGGANFNFQYIDMELTTEASSGYRVYASAHGDLTLNSVNLKVNGGATAAILQASNHSRITLSGDINVTGNGAALYSLIQGYYYGVIYMGPSLVLTLSEIPSFNYSAYAAYFSAIYCAPAMQLNHDSGMTGRRYTCTIQSHLQLAGHGENFLPGDLAGTFDSTSSVNL